MPLDAVRLFSVQKQFWSFTAPRPVIFLRITVDTEASLLACRLIP